MDFMSRGAGRPDSVGPAARPPMPPHKSKHVDWAGRAVRIEWFVFTLLVAIILIVAIIWLIFSGSPGTSESKLVNNNDYQAVFLNGGATSGSVAYTTYFGHITKLNNSYVVLKDVFYLTTPNSTGQNQNTSPQLTKLGCQQLHWPYDEMVINRSQVAFWENLNAKGKVVQAIQQFNKQNPNGPDCSSTNSSAPASTGTSTQNSTSTQSSTSTGNSGSNSSSTSKP